MASLICTFASQRSSPEKIHRFITWLQEKRVRNAGDPRQVAVIDVLLSAAHGWLDGGIGTQA